MILWSNATTVQPVALVSPLRIAVSSRVNPVLLGIMVKVAGALMPIEVAMVANLKYLKSRCGACINARMLACTIIMAHMPQCVYTCVLKYMYACGHVSTHMHESMNAGTHMHKHAATYTSMQCPPTSNVAPTSAAVFDGGLWMGIERGEGSSRCREWMGG